MLRALLPTDRWTRALLAPALVVIATAVDRNYQTDLWHHLARGRAIAAEGRLLDSDRFTFTVPDRPLQDNNWAWQVLFYRLHQVGGLPLVQAVNSAVLAVMMALLVRLAWRQSGSLPAAAVVCTFAFFGLWQLLLIRPQTFSLLLFVLLYGTLEGAGRRRRLLLWPPVLLAAWVNLHGGFPIGLILVGCYVLAAFVESSRTDKEPRSQGAKGTESGSAPGERRTGQSVSGSEPGLVTLSPCHLVTLSSRLRRTWPWAVCLGASLAATLANPYGWRVYQYVGLTSTAAPGRQIDEWLPPGLTTLTGKVWVASLLLTVVGLGLSRGKVTRRELCLLCCFLPLACGSVRMVAWWLLILAPILAARLTARWPRLAEADVRAEAPSVAAGLGCGLLLLAAVLSLPWLERLNPVLALPGRAHRTEDDLQAVADHLGRDRPAGRVFTRLAWGEYLGWSLAPHYTVFMDGRIEIFPDPVWAQYAAVTRGRGDWEEILAGYDVDCLVLDADGYHRELLPQVRRSGAWKEVLQKGSAVLFVRQPAGEAGQTAAR
jgi:hypothetical protein